LGVENLENALQNIYSKARKKDWGVKKNMGSGKRKILNDESQK
jgi:hypothetical protein